MHINGITGTIGRLVEFALDAIQRAREALGNARKQARKAQEEYETIHALVIQARGEYDGQTEDRTQVDMSE